MPSQSLQQVSTPETVRVPANLQWFRFNALVQLIIIAVFTAWAMNTPLMLLALPMLFLLARTLIRWHRATLRPALSADAEGITDDTHEIPGGLVRWDEIKDIEEKMLAGDNSLIIHLHDPAAYMRRLPEWKQALLAGNLQQFGTPCIVGQSSLGLPISDVRNWLEMARMYHTRSYIQPNVGESNRASTVAPTVAPGRWWTAVPPEERKAQPLQQNIGNNSDR